jgi:hypothetical protein
MGMLIPNHTGGLPRWVNYVVSFVFSWLALASVINVTVHRVDGTVFESHHVNAWFQHWYDAVDAGKFRFDPVCEPMISISGVFTLGAQKAEILYRLASYPSFDDDTIIFCNRVMTREQAKVLIRSQYGLDDDMLEHWCLMMWDHNGAFRDCLDDILPSFLDAKIAPSIHWGYDLSGHGGYSDKSYTAGMIRIHMLAEWLYRAGHDTPDILIIESCNGDGTTPVAELLAQDGVFPKRLVFTPGGYPTCAYLASMARKLGLESEQNLFAPVYYQWGIGEPGWGWALQRLNIEPVYSAIDTKEFMNAIPGLLQDYGSAVGLNGQIDTPELRHACHEIANELTAPVIHNNSDHEFVVD